MDQLCRGIHIVVRQSIILVLVSATRAFADPISTVSFDDIPGNVSFETSATGDINLNGDTEVNGNTLLKGQVDIATGAVSTNILEVSGDPGAEANEMLELENTKAAYPLGQFIEFQNVPDGIVGQIHGDGSAWFQDDDKPLPAFLPQCFGVITFEGFPLNGSGNFTSTYIAGSSHYEIDCPGSFLTATHTMVVTAIDTSAPQVPVYFETGLRAGVKIFNLAGDLIKSDFSFVIYDNTALGVLGDPKEAE